MNFKKINSITGWMVFMIASAVYVITAEPTASFWDCGEFISTAYKLEVGHPPGAPFFMLVARIFTLFAGGNTELVARMVNIFSALCSGFTILLLFWTITHLGRKIIGKAAIDFTPAQTFSVIGAGMVGALAYTFSDTFWFSAVEGEVYAFSSLFTALVFWAVLRWEDEADQRHANRWLVLIAYLMGLSIGVHLLNLLAIPAIGLVYYHRKYPVTAKGTIYALLISAGVLLVILYGIVPGVIQIAVWFELFFVKNIGLPMNTGMYLYAALLIGGIIYGLYYSLKHQKIVLNSAILFVTVIIIGYASYAALIIRSSAEPPMDQNNPQNLFNLQYYLNREQYGDRPLIIGPYYNSEVKYDSDGRPVVKEGKTLYAKKDNQYVEIGKKTEYVYEDKSTTIFPRMYSREASHIEAYKDWGRISPTQPKTKLPTFGQNLYFFFSYQVGYMYLRYFLWNFVGRQDDIQGHGGPVHGNWISGITPLDEARLGPQDLPESLHNKGRNVYFFLPLILGIVGMFFQFNRDKPNFWVTMMLFFMTGIAIVLYLNQTPYQPRERDYAYAGSFYAFAIWIGLGVMAIIDAVPEKYRNKYITAVISLILVLLVPGIMAKENWDDHDRSGRYTARDFAYNYLISCEPNAIIFTNGDNDTFPLWYAQEVEGVGTDKRVVNLSYLAADWYIEQMSRAAYTSKPLPFSLRPDQYMQGSRDVVYIFNDKRIGKNEYVELKDIMRLITSDDNKTKWQVDINTYIDYIPTNRLKIKVDKQQVLKSGTVAPEDSALIVPEIRWTLKGEKSGETERFYKNSLMVLDILANNNWERPVYFAITVSPENFLNLTDYFRLDGLAYRFVPVRASSTGGIDTDILYDKMMNQFRWGNLSDPKVYLDETNLRLIAHFRGNFARLANALIREGKKETAIEVLDRAYEVIPTHQLPLTSVDLFLTQQYYSAGASEKGNDLAGKMFETAKQEMLYYMSFPRRFSQGIYSEYIGKKDILRHLCSITWEYEQRDLYDSFKKQWDTIFPGEPWNKEFQDVTEAEELPEN